MKDIWRQRYQSLNVQPLNKTVLVGFNANIDVKHDLDDKSLDLDETEPENLEEVSSSSEFKSLLAYCMDKGLNKEVSYEGFEPEVEEDRREIGGQAGIMANFLDRNNAQTLFYTPFLSEELSKQLSNSLEVPNYSNGDIEYRSPSDSVNTDRTKINRIFEFEDGKTGRLILSDRLRGFGPYFRQGIEENLDEIDEKIDRALLSGFHNAEGNVEAKLAKASEQLEKMNSPIHMEYVDLSSKLGLLQKYIFPHIESIGLDEHEMKKLEEGLDLSLDGEKPSLGEAFQFAKFFIEKFDLSRVHIHTYSYHLNVTENDYEVGPEKIRESMLYGETCAIKMADEGEIPECGSTLEFDNKHLRRLDEIEDFADFMGLEEFAETGIAEVEEFKVVAVPPVIHEDPERLVGMGDLISAGSFVREID
ncbi:MAG: ADP-dependent glucokinase/phosphofructokinase [Candidatus Nanohaloarchaea archaeon]